MQKSCKKIGNEEGIGKDQCPGGHSLKTDLNPFYTFRLTNTVKLASVHLLFLTSYPFFYNLNDAKTHDQKHKNNK
jgi:hypothetical protein